MSSSLIDVLDRHGVSARQTGKPSEYIITCPQCGKSKLYINVEKRLWVCYVCAEGGAVRKLLKLLNIDHRQEFATDFDSLRKQAETDFAQRTGQPEEQADEVHTLPDEYKPLVPGAPMQYVGKSVFDYLIGRGVSAEQIVAWKLGYCAEGKYAGCCIIPVCDKNGAVVTFQGRRVLGHGQKSMNPMGSGGFMFNLEFARSRPGLVVVEGPFDALSIHADLAYTMGISSVALLRHSISDEQAAYIARVIRPRIVWVGLDPDVDESYMHKVGGVLRVNGCPEVFVALFPKDPDDLSVDEKVRCLDEAQPARVVRKA